jgi:hypothetical protein
MSMYICMYMDWDCVYFRHSIKQSHIPMAPHIFKFTELSFESENVCQIQIGSGVEESVKYRLRAITAIL